MKVIDLTKLALNKFNAMFGAVEWIQTKGATGSFPEVSCPASESHLRVYINVLSRTRSQLRVAKERASKVVEAAMTVRTYFLPSINPPHANELRLLSKQQVGTWSYRRVPQQARWRPSRSPRSSGIPPRTSPSKLPYPQQLIGLVPSWS